MSAPRHITLALLRQELRRGGIVEAPIENRQWHLSGVFDPPTEIVVVNPAPELAKSVLHELTHRARPRWGEARVDRESRRVLASMSTADVAAFVKLYRRTRHRRQLVKVDAV